ncbi:TonB-dependent receptor [Bacteroides sp. 51]|uniref:SusC/RagA family TonB-linked outer membrane protein n=1 Tax=Bacteroides sp. 51 TaxID=2302938 RepID=UPI0013D19C0B|nr:TonB-dependent receptor [Bacteroides sp. 51]NDV84023.1 TonB-dependent receptor [Bacteroides sp. 51]
MKSRFRTKKILLLGVLLFGLSITTFAQEVSLNYNNVDLEEVLLSIKKQTGYSLIFSDQVLDVHRKITIKAEKEELPHVLTDLFENSNVAFEIKNKKIYFIPRQQKDSTPTEPNTISGIVSDENGEPIIGANILVKETSNGAISDLEGKFSLINVPKDAILEVSFIGYDNQELKLKNEKKIAVILKENSTLLEELVVIGYGTVRKRNLTGSVSQINAEQIQKAPVTNILQSIQGRIPGLQITQNSGQPGDGSSVLIHGKQSINGTNAPIYVIDGSISENINGLNPQDIETLTVLKDASTVAIYGSRAANGVIVINTKRGRQDDRTTITFKTEQSFQQESNLKFKFLNADQWLEIATESYTNAGKNVPWTTAELEKVKGIDNCWPDLMKRTGYLTNNNLSITGGSKNSNYFISLNYLHNDGIIKDQSYNRVNLRLNSDHKIGSRLKFGHSINIYSSKQKTQRDFDYLNTYSVAFRMTPFNGMYDENGDYATISSSSLQSDTPTPAWMLDNSEVSIHDKGIDGNLYLSVDILEGLKFTARASGDWKNRFTDDFIGAMDKKYGMQGSNVNRVMKKNAETFHWIIDYIIDYQKVFKQDHEISAMLGYSAEKQTFQDLMGSRGNTPSNEIHFLNAGDPSTALNDNSWTEWSFLSQFGRLSYSYKDRYYFNGVIRRDGSSRLAQDKYGIFPSVSAAWRIKEEKFMSGLEWMNELKLRLSWGKVGNVLSIDPYGTSIYLNQRNAVFNQKVVSGYSFTNAVNQDLKWESTEKKDIGFDLSMLNNRLYVVFDYYIEDTKNLLFNQPIASSVGLMGSPYINAGHVRNRGIDFEIGYRQTINNWKFDVSFNASHIKNEVIDLEGRDLDTSGIKEGYPIGSFYGYVSNGIIRTQEDLDNNPHFAGKGIGDIWFTDINGYDENGNLTGKPDGKVDTADRTLFGKIFPDLSYGVTGSLSYKNLTLQIQLQGVQGIEKSMLAGGLITDMFSGMPNAEADYILDRYSDKNPKGKYPRVIAGDPGRNQNMSDFWLIDASYLSIRNLNLSYNFPKSFCNRMGAVGINAYVGVQNLWTFGNEYSEITNTRTIPFARTCTFGLQITL